MNIKKDILWRIGIIYIGMVLLALGILYNMVKLQFIEASHWKQESAKLKVEDVILEADRGSILSDDGRKLACSVPGYRIYMDTRAKGLTGKVFRENIDSLALCLSQLFRDKSPAAYRNDLVVARRKGLQYYSVSKKRISVLELKKLRKFPIFRLGANKGGLIVESDDSRKMPFGSLGARTLGKFTLERDSTGKRIIRGIGLELAFNDVLAGSDGVGDKAKVGGMWVNEIQVAPVDGNDIVSTLNIEIQDVAEHALREQLIRHNARYGVAVVMEVKTGAVKAMVNLHRAAPGAYVEDHFNYAVGQSTEPGSTFKLASLMVALEDGVVDINDVVDTGDGTVKFFDRTMTDSSKDHLGKMTVTRAFEVSSNVGISKIIYENYKKNPEKFLDGLSDLGIDEKLGIEITGEVPPFVNRPDRKTWSGTTLPWMSIGYEVKMTPLQVLAFYNAVANNGTMVRPKFVAGVSRHGKMIDEFGTDVINSSICSSITLRKVRNLLEGVVENGTAMNLRNEHYKIAGKTGTALIAQGSKGYGINGYRSEDGGKSYQASFVGYFPAERPLYSCIVVVNGPSNNVYYGNVVAGSVFKEISDRLYAANFKNRKIFKEPEPLLTRSMPYSKAGQRSALKKVLSKVDLDYDDNSETDWVGGKAGEREIEVVSKEQQKGLVPNVKGFGATDAVTLLESLGMKVYLSGIGKVVNQSVQPGVRYHKGDRIVLRLN
ncbi:MAG: penicillin-binding transpeptidase domain-containing protein [Breznakibacter sp.]